MIGRIAGMTFAALVVAVPVTARATGGADCTIDDANLALDISGAFSYSDIGGLFQIRGDLVPKDPRTYKTLRRIALGDADLKQQWFRDKQLKMMLYRETEGDGVPYAYVKLIIETENQGGEEFDYSGDYTLTIEPATSGSDSAAFTVTGKVTCSVG